MRNIQDKYWLNALWTNVGWRKISSLSLIFRLRFENKTALASRIMSTSWTPIYYTFFHTSTSTTTLLITFYSPFILRAESLLECINIFWNLNNLIFRIGMFNIEMAMCIFYWRSWWWPKVIDVKCWTKYFCIANENWQRMKFVDVGNEKRKK